MSVFSTHCARTLSLCLVLSYCSDLGPDCTRSFTVWEFDLLVQENTLNSFSFFSLFCLFLTASGAMCVSRSGLRGRCGTLNLRPLLQVCTKLRALTRLRTRRTRHAKPPLRWPLSRLRIRGCLSCIKSRILRDSAASADLQSVSDPDDGMKDMDSKTFSF